MQALARQGRLRSFGRRHHRWSTTAFEHHCGLSGQSGSFTQRLTRAIVGVLGERTSNGALR